MWVRIIHLTMAPTPHISELKYAPTHGTFPSFLEIYKIEGAYSLQIYDYYFWDSGVVQWLVHGTESQLNEDFSCYNTSRTANPPHGDLVLSGVLIRAGPNLDILGVKFDSKLTFEDHLCSMVFRVSRRIGILRLVNHVFVDTSVLLRCYYAFFSQSLRIVLGHEGQLLNVTYSFYSTRCIRWRGFALIIVSYYCAIDVMLLVNSNYINSC